MDEREDTHRPDAPKAAHLPARDQDFREEKACTGAADLMAAVGGKRDVAAWVLRVCGSFQAWRAP